MITIHDPILGDIEITADRYLVIVTNVDTRESRELVVATNVLPEPTEDAAGYWVGELVGEPWVIRLILPVVGHHAVI
ncbi:hypothetical protein [Nocardia asteroides]|uniref:hypothetical protein n=1 Tax=Nocardia asteroides TaxID=1824 RepID=UPI001E45D7CF|nr:hypothetical protein [Nocardia asteroides]UGT58865.1 hypothetical protein LTT85_33475 [Nocardia asteroides]